MAELSHIGIRPYFTFFVDADIMDSKSNLFQLYQGGISLGEKEYYLDTDEATTDIRNKYKEHIVKMFGWRALMNLLPGRIWRQCLKLKHA